ncbi:hypothetical protein G3M53_44215 [Streptomyces sp. SID7982]|nr:hypothetical protein [Streptomyces sp. SID7982]
MAIDVDEPVVVGCLQQNERPREPGVPRGVPRHDLDGDERQIHAAPQVQKLLPHDVGIAHLGVQDALLQDEVKDGPGFALQDLLAAEPVRHPLLDLVLFERWVVAVEDEARVRLGLE